MRQSVAVFMEDFKINNLVKKVGFEINQRMCILQLDGSFFAIPYFLTGFFANIRCKVRRCKPNALAVAEILPLLASSVN